MSEAREQMESWYTALGGEVYKEAEIANTWGMPAQEPSDKKVVKSKTVIQKEGSHLPGTKDVCPDDNLHHPVKGEQPQRNAQSGNLKPRIDVSDKEPPKVIKEKTAEHLALPSLGRYPLDRYDQVKHAAVYFEEWRNQFAPHHRREFCVNLVKRAAALGIDTSEEIQKYGSATYAPAAQVEMAIDARRALLTDEDHGEMLSKLAEARPIMSPEAFALTLVEFDKFASLDQHYDRDLVDPFYSTFGKEAKQAKSIVIGNDYVTEEQVEGLAMMGHATVELRFGDDFANEFRKDPMGIFNSLPVTQKKMLMRMASDNAPTDSKTTVG